MKERPVGCCLEVREQSSGEEITWPDLTKGVALEQLSSESYNSASHSLASSEQLSDNEDKEDLK